MSFNNNVSIHNDGKTLFVKLEVVSSRFGRIVLLFFTIIIGLFIGALFFFGDFKGKELNEILMFIGVISIFLLTLNYYMWNRYGYEELLVTTKSISYSYFYGIIHTNLKTIIFNELSVEFLVEQGHGEERVGKIVFYNYKDSDGLPEDIHTTNVLINEATYNFIVEEIRKLYYDVEKDNIINYSLN